MKEYIVGIRDKQEVLKELNNNPELRDKFILTILSHLTHTSYVNDKHSKEINLSGIYTQDGITSGCDEDYFFLFYLYWKTECELEDIDDDYESEEDV